AAGPPDDLAALDARAHLHFEARQVGIVRRHAAAVVDDNDVAIAVLPAGELHDAREAGADGFAPVRLDVAARVKARAARERVAAVAEGAADLRGRNHRARFIFRLDSFRVGLRLRLCLGPQV